VRSLAETEPEEAEFSPSRISAERASTVKTLIAQLPAEQRQPLRRQPIDHNSGSLMMRAVTAGVFMVVTWAATKGLFMFLQESPTP
jgi:hypothetical protein